MHIGNQSSTQLERKKEILKVRGETGKVGCHFAAAHTRTDQMKEPPEWVSLSLQACFPRALIDNLGAVNLQYHEWMREAW